MCARTSTVLLTRDGNLTRPFGGAVEHGLLDRVHVLKVRVGGDVEDGPDDGEDGMQRRGVYRT